MINTIIVTFYLLDRIIKLDWVLNIKVIVWSADVCDRDHTSTDERARVWVRVRVYVYVCVRVMDITDNVVECRDWLGAEDYQSELASCPLLQGSIVNYHLSYVVKCLQSLIAR